MGIECTGSYGAGITRKFLDAGYTVVEVNQPNRFDRRRRGKTDQFDVYAAAEAFLSGRATALPKGNDGLVESLRVLRTTQSAGVRDCTATINQIRAMLVSAPEPLRQECRGMTRSKLVAALAATRPPTQPVTAAESTLSSTIFSAPVSLREAAGHPICEEVAEQRVSWVEHELVQVTAAAAFIDLDHSRPHRVPDSTPPERVGPVIGR